MWFRQERQGFDSHVVDSVQVDSRAQRIFKGRSLAIHLTERKG